jgi:hypothetical protein
MLGVKVLTGLVYYYSTHRKAACPHPRCQDDENQYYKNDLVLHFHDVHGIEDI